MFKKVFALGLVAAASAAGAPAATNMRLRGGGAFGDLTKAPSKCLVLEPPFPATGSTIPSSERPRCLPSRLV